MTNIAINSVDGSDSGRITIIIHGTFAAEERWWRLGELGSVNFADRLEYALDERGLQGTVWKPALAHGLSYGDFSWSGKNKHKDRLNGAIRVAKSLNSLADKLECSTASPLKVNIVAHSHGGNVALEMLPQLSPTVRPQQLVLLGTPLISHRTALRPMRVILGIFLLMIVMLLVCGAIINLFDPSFAPKFGRLELFGWSGLMIVAYGWLFWVVATIADFALRWLMLPLRMTTGRLHGQAYGPRPAVLKSVLSRKAVLLTSFQDEADLALQLGAAPRRLYIDEVKSRLSGVAKVGEIIFLRPFMDGLVLKAIEALMERYVLGFPWYQVMFRDFESVGEVEGSAYPGDVIERIDVTNELIEPLRDKIQSASRTRILETREIGGDVAERGSQSLRNTMINVVQGITTQIRLRHSVYYESDSVTNRIADLLAK